jgi:hypothetical protein
MTTPSRSDAAWLAAIFGIAELTGEPPEEIAKLVGEPPADKNATDVPPEATDAGKDGAS